MVLTRRQSFKVSQSEQDTKQELNDANTTTQQQQQQQANHLMGVKDEITASRSTTTGGTCSITTTPSTGRHGVKQDGGVNKMGDTFNLQPTMTPSKKPRQSTKTQINDLDTTMCDLNSIPLPLTTSDGNNNKNINNDTATKTDNNNNNNNDNLLFSLSTEHLPISCTPSASPSHRASTLNTSSVIYKIQIPRNNIKDVVDDDDENEEIIPTNNRSTIIRIFPNNNNNNNNNSNNTTTQPRKSYAAVVSDNANKALQTLQQQHQIPSAPQPTSSTITFTTPVRNSDGTKSNTMTATKTITITPRPPQLEDVNVLYNQMVLNPHDRMLLPIPLSFIAAIPTDGIPHYYNAIDLFSTTNVQLYCLVKVIDVNKDKCSCTLTDGETTIKDYVFVDDEDKGYINSVFPGRLLSMRRAMHALLRGEPFSFRPKKALATDITTKLLLHHRIVAEQYIINLLQGVASEDEVVAGEESKKYCWQRDLTQEMKETLLKAAQQRCWGLQSQFLGVSNTAFRTAAEQATIDDMDKKLKQNIRLNQETQNKNNNNNQKNINNNHSPSKLDFESEVPLLEMSDVDSIATFGADHDRLNEDNHNDDDDDDDIDLEAMNYAVQQSHLATKRQRLLDGYTSNSNGSNNNNKNKNDQVYVQLGIGGPINDNNNSNTLTNDIETTSHNSNNPFDHIAALVVEKQEEQEKQKQLEKEKIIENIKKAKLSPYAKPFYPSSLPLHILNSVAPQSQSSSNVDTPFSANTKAMLIQQEQQSTNNNNITTTQQFNINDPNLQQQLNFTPQQLQYIMAQQSQMNSIYQNMMKDKDDEIQSLKTRLLSYEKTIENLSLALAKK